MSAPQVYQAISAVMADLAKEGIGKDRKNEQQGYKFRGIDDLYNALASKLAAHGLLLLPRYSGQLVAPRGKTAKGSDIYGATLQGDIDFVSVKDGSKHTVTVFGEAVDQSDKATNKAMSAAFKYACLQAFCIPTEGDNDADASHHETGGEVPKHPFNVERLDALKKQLSGLTTMEQLMMFVGSIEKESEAVKTTLRPLFKEMRAKLEAK